LPYYCQQEVNCPESGALSEKENNPHNQILSVDYITLGFLKGSLLVGVVLFWKYGLIIFFSFKIHLHHELQHELSQLSHTFSKAAHEIWGKDSIFQHMKKIASLMKWESLVFQGEKKGCTHVLYYSFTVLETSCVLGGDHTESVAKIHIQPMLMISIICGTWEMKFMVWPAIWRFMNADSMAGTLMLE
jgi:hypothetical protein